MSQPEVPVVLWAQRADRVFVSIQLDEVTEEKVSVDQSTLSFSGKSKGLSYSLCLELNDSIKPDECKQRKGGREYFFELKKVKCEKWPRLIKDTKRCQNIRCDFSRYQDSDDSDEEIGAYNDASLEDMMHQMNMPDDFNPGDMPDEDDSDDEEIPSLEECKE